MARVGPQRHKKKAINICPIGYDTVQSGRNLNVGKETPSIFKVFFHYEGGNKFFINVGRF